MFFQTEIALTDTSNACNSSRAIDRKLYLAAQNRVTNLGKTSSKKRPASQTSYYESRIKRFFGISVGNSLNLRSVDDKNVDN